MFSSWLPFMTYQLSASLGYPELQSRGISLLTQPCRVIIWCSQCTHNWDGYNRCFQRLGILALKLDRSAWVWANANAMACIIFPCFVMALATSLLYFLLGGPLLTHSSLDGWFFFCSAWNALTSLRYSSEKIQKSVCLWNRSSTPVFQMPLFKIVSRF